MKKLFLVPGLMGLVSLALVINAASFTVFARKINESTGIQQYQDKALGYSFQYSSDLTAYPQPNFYDLTSVVSLINEDKYPNSEIAINTFTNIQHLSPKDWLIKHDEASNLIDNAKPLGGKLSKIQELTSENTYELNYKVLDKDCETVLIWTNDQVYTISYYYNENPIKDLHERFENIVSSFNISEKGRILENYTSETQTGKIDPISVTFKKPEIIFAQAVTISYKLPWTTGNTKQVTQGWNSGYSHIGIESYAYDFSLAEGENVLASAGGTIAISKGDTDPSVCGYGSTYASLANRVIINHPDGAATLYLHLRSVSVPVGTSVTQGQVIGTAGKTGWTKGPLSTDTCGAHLHFQREGTISTQINNWYNQSQTVYFSEYPGQQLQVNTIYTSSNNGINQASNLLLVQAIDFDGDGRKDTTYFDPTTGEWHINKSNSNWSESIIPFTIANAMPVGGSDFDADGRTDLAVFNQVTGEWKIRYSDDGVVENKGVFGWSTCIPVGGVNINKDSLNGHPKHDMAIYDRANGRWYIRPSLQPGNDIVITNLGWSTAIPVVGNYKYDNDNLTDIGIFDTNTGWWYVRPSVVPPTQGGSEAAINFGWSSTTPLSNGDYDADGKTDLAMWDRNSSHWYIRPSSGGADWDIQMGWSTTIPLQGFNFYTTNRANLAMFDYATATWYLRPNYLITNQDWVWTWGNSSVVPM